MPEAHRIGVGTGFAGDRDEPAGVLLERVALDALVFECLAERTIALAHERLAGGGLGYDPRIVDRVRRVLPVASARGVTIITNAGAADPRGAAIAIRDAAHDLGLRPVIAVVTGDDVRDLLDPDAVPDGEDARIGDLGDRVVSANAYLGAAPVVDALVAGAAIVVTGRVGDAALFAAPVMHHHGWSIDDLPRMADGVLVGHLLECGGQLTGGYFADGVRKHVPGLDALGFPFAEVSPDGSAVLGKAPGTGGRLDAATTLEQLLYEVADPAAYLTPDVTVDFSRVRIAARGSDTVAVSGAAPRGRPAALKVSVGVRDGHVGVGEISYGGAFAAERAALAAQVVRERWRHLEELRIDRGGMNALHRWQASDRRADEIRVRFAVRSFDRSVCVELAREVEALYTNGPAGGGGVVTHVRETIGIVSTLLDREAVSPRVEVIR